MVLCSRDGPFGVTHGSARDVVAAIPLGELENASSSVLDTVVIRAKIAKDQPAI
jgi:hypothetical protein